MQTLRNERTREKVVEKHRSDLLKGLVYDAHGRNVAVFRDYRRNPVGTRYYRSNQNEWGRRNGVRLYRAKADDLEELILSALRARLVRREDFRDLLVGAGLHGAALSRGIKTGSRLSRLFESLSPLQLQSVLRTLVERIDISDDEVVVVLCLDQLVEFTRWDGMGLFRKETNQLSPAHLTRAIVIQTSTVRFKRDLYYLYAQRRTPEGVAKNPYLIKLMRSARRAQKLVDDAPQLSFTELAKRCNCSHSRLPRLLRLNYLAPDIIASIFDGRQPGGLTGHKLMAKDLPQDWSLQRKILGFAEQQDTLQGAPGWSG